MSGVNVAHEYEKCITKTVKRFRDNYKSTLTKEIFKCSNNLWLTWQTVSYVLVVVPAVYNSFTYLIVNLSWYEILKPRAL